MIGIVFALLKDVALSVVTKIAFKVVAERFATRLVIHGLKKLKNYSTNEVVTDTVNDVLVQLKGKKLKVADDTALIKEEVKNKQDIFSL